MGRLTTHVLDLARGTPAQGMRISLYRREAENAADGADLGCLQEAVTNDDGRLDSPLLHGEEMLPGTYELVFHAGEYFHASHEMSGAAEATAYTSLLRTEHTPSPPIWDDIPVRFRIHCRSDCLHIPLLIAPGGYSTYRGS